MSGKYLFVDWEGGGNLPPALTLARQMVARGHRVRVLSDPADEADVRAAGCEYVSYTRALHRHDKSAENDFIRDWEARTPMAALARSQDRASCAGRPSPTHAMCCHLEVRMGRDKQAKRQTRTVYAPQPKDDTKSPVVISVELDEEEDVEWTWTHTADGESVVTGYTIIKKAEKPRESAESEE